MGINSAIQWTKHTWNIARGCRKKDQDCKFCYMYRDSLKGKRYNPYKIQKTKSVFDLPLRTKEPSLFFTSSLTDVFLEEIDSFRHEVWDIIRQCPHHTFQILTKRPERILECLPADWGLGWDNVWLGTSVGSPKGLSRIDDLARVPSKTRFVSFEPLWARIPREELAKSNLSKIHWAIIGGETGNENGKYRYRPCNTEWIEELIETLRPYSKIFVKQLGTYLSKKLKLSDRHGGVIEEWPAHLQIREMPN